MKTITLAGTCHNFQQRLCFMLSSLQQQSFSDNIIFDIAHVKENGKPTTERIAEMWELLSPKIILRSYYSEDEIKFRGTVRNDQIKNCQTDFLLFVDCDMVYHPEFFKNLTTLLTDDEKYSNHSGFMKAGRYSTVREEIDKIVGSIIDDDHPVFVKDVWNSFAPYDKIKKANVGAGYFQLINMSLCDHGGYYVDPKSNRDYDWHRKYSKCRSDQQFRRRIGNIKSLPKWFSRNQVHLNHYRDSEFQKHISLQR